MLTFRVRAYLRVAICLLSSFRRPPPPPPSFATRISRVFPLIKSLNRVGEKLTTPPYPSTRRANNTRDVRVPSLSYARALTVHAGGGGGVAGTNAQKLIKDRVVCPAGAWCPGDLTARSSAPSSPPVPSRFRSRLKPGSPSPTAHTLPRRSQILPRQSSMYKRRRERRCPADRLGRWV